MQNAPKGSKHVPEDTSLLENNCYDWIIEAKAPGRVSTTQTTLWESEDSNGYNLKACPEIFVNVVVEVKDSTIIKEISAKLQEDIKHIPNMIELIEIIQLIIN